MTEANMERIAKNHLLMFEAALAQENCTPAEMVLALSLLFRVTTERCAQWLDRVPSDNPDYRT